MSPIKVFARSRASAVAGTIAGMIREHRRAELLALGEAAVDRALRAVDLAIVYCRQDGIDVGCMMESAADETIRLIVEAQDSSGPRMKPESSNSELDLEMTRNNLLTIEHCCPPSGGDINSPDAGCVWGVYVL